MPKPIRSSTGFSPRRQTSSRSPSRSSASLAHGIHPGALTQAGLSSALEALAARVPIPVTVDATTERFPAEVEVTAYFVASEALANVVKHAQASKVAVSAQRDDGTLVIEVSDDGVGGASAQRRVRAPRARRSPGGARRAPLGRERAAARARAWWGRSRARRDRRGLCAPARGARARALRRRLRGRRAGRERGRAEEGRAPVQAGRRGGGRAHASDADGRGRASRARDPRRAAGGRRASPVAGHRGDARARAHQRAARRLRVPAEGPGARDRRLPGRRAARRAREGRRSTRR